MILGIFQCLIPNKMTTIAIQVKEKMANMPDTLNTKKELEAYFKDVMKNITVTVVDKPKRELTAYQQYVRDNSKPVKEQNPQLTGKEVFSLIAKMWRESQNGDNAKPAKEEKKDEKEPVKEEDKASDVKEQDTEIEEVKPPDVKAKKKK
jgi:hypothetical protein